MTRKETEEKNELHRLFHKLRHNTYELRSSITTLLLYLDSMETMDEDKRASSLEICEQINSKNNELIYAEELVESVLDEFMKEKQK